MGGGGLGKDDRLGRSYQHSRQGHAATAQTSQQLEAIKSGKLVVEDQAAKLWDGRRSQQTIGVGKGAHVEALDLKGELERAQDGQSSSTRINIPGVWLLMVILPAARKRKRNHGRWDSCV